MCGFDFLFFMLTHFPLRVHFISIFIIYTYHQQICLSSFERRQQQQQQQQSTYSLQKKIANVSKVIYMYVIDEDQ